MTVVLTGIESIPLIEDDPAALASYRLTVSLDGEPVILDTTVLKDGDITFLHCHSPAEQRAIEEACWLAEDFQSPYKPVFALHQGRAVELPWVVAK